MSDLKRNLQDYLAKGQSSEPLLNGEDDKMSFSRFNPFAKKSVEDQSASSDVANGWFAQAQKDPCLPSLVSCSLNTDA